MTNWSKLKLNEGRVILDGEPITLDLQNTDVTAPMVCCDCGLTHNIWYRLHKGKLTMRVWRDGESTAIVRKQMQEACNSQEFIDSFVAAHERIAEETQNETQSENGDEGAVV